jgi:hypothetical protein
VGPGSRTCRAYVAHKQLKKHLSPVGRFIWVEAETVWIAVYHRRLERPRCFNQQVSLTKAHLWREMVSVIAYGSLVFGGAYRLSELHDQPTEVAISLYSRF